MSNTPQARRKWPLVLLGITSVIFLTHLINGNSKPDLPPDLDAKIAAAMNNSKMMPKSSTSTPSIDELAATAPTSTLKPTSEMIAKPATIEAEKIATATLPSQSQTVELSAEPKLVPPLQASVNPIEQFDQPIDLLKFHDKIPNEIAKTNIPAKTFFYFRYYNFLLSFSIKKTNVRKPGPFPQIYGELRAKALTSCKNCILLPTKMNLFLRGLEIGTHSFSDSNWTLNARKAKNCTLSEHIDFQISDDLNQDCSVGQLREIIVFKTQDNQFNRKPAEQKFRFYLTSILDDEN